MSSSIADHLKIGHALAAVGTLGPQERRGNFGNAQDKNIQNCLAQHINKTLTRKASGVTLNCATACNYLLLWPVGLLKIVELGTCTSCAFCQQLPLSATCTIISCKSILQQLLGSTQRKRTDFRTNHKSVESDIHRNQE
jgi:hypothetical protein